MSKLKKHFDESQARDMLAMRDNNYSLGRIARAFQTNKPSILKALRLWDSGEQFTSEGKAFIITRGKVTMMPHKDKKPKPVKQIKKVKPDKFVEEMMVESETALGKIKGREL